MQQVNNSKGFSLVEIMIATGILAGLVLVSLQLSSNTKKINTVITQKFELAYAIDEMRTLLVDPANCLASFGDLTIGEENLNVVKHLKRVDSDGVSTEVFQTPTKGIVNLLSSNLFIKGYDIETVGSGLGIGVDGIGYTNLKIKFGRGKVHMRGLTVSRKIKLYLKLSTQNKLVACSSDKIKHNRLSLITIDSHPHYQGVKAETACSLEGKICGYTMKHGVVQVGMEACEIPLPKEFSTSPGTCTTKIGLEVDEKDELDENGVKKKCARMIAAFCVD